MSDFLETILATKQQEVRRLRLNPELNREYRRQSPSSLASEVTRHSHLAIIAEIKKASPSKGLIQPNFQPLQTAVQYESFGASAISVLTDASYFQGSVSYLEAIANRVQIPVLRKDFIIDETQIHEAVLAGADAILLIAAALPAPRLRSLSQHAKNCNLEVLLEIHSPDELEAALSAEPSVLGINNRDLTTFNVNLETTEAIMPHVGRSVPVIAESGVASLADANRMRDAGVSGLLVGESLMRRSQNSESLEELFKQLQVPKLQPETQMPGDRQ